MPRISKLSNTQIEELKVDLCDPRKSLQRLSIKFHIAPASIFYYKKKFVPVIAAIYSLPVAPEAPKKTVRTYESYLREYYARIGKPYQVPAVKTPNGKYLEWLSGGSFA